MKQTPRILWPKNLAVAVIICELFIVVLLHTNAVTMCHEKNGFETFIFWLFYPQQIMCLSLDRFSGCLSFAIKLGLMGLLAFPPSLVYARMLTSVVRKIVKAF